VARRTSLRPNSTIQKLKDASVHDWYRFVLAYPDHLVSDVLDRFGVRNDQVVLDPFAGTGTTLVECKKRGIDSIGIDANPVSSFASKVKTTWDIDLAEFDHRRRDLLRYVRGAMRSMGSKQFPFQLSFDDLLPAKKVVQDSAPDGYEDLKALLPKNWISPLPLRRVLELKRAIDQMEEGAITDLFRLALATVIVADASNLGFGPEVYVKKQRKDANVSGAFAEKLRKMRYDLEVVQRIPRPGAATVHCGDARLLTSMVGGSIDFVITSPPYPNEKDYTRTTRLELILLGFIQKKNDLRQLKQGMLRSHTRNIYKADNDSKCVADVPEIQQVSKQIEQRRIKRGATSGFERLYHRVVTEYFGGMYRVLEQLQRVMPPGGKLALVVGDQMSYFRVPIRTAKLLSLVACRKLDYAEVETVIWRTRRATATNMDIEEHILVLERQ
jgi:hypothetical protein